MWGATSPAEGSVDQDTDCRIMTRIREGEVGDLRILFERHASRLLGFFLRLSGDREVSEDMVQEVFYRILKFKKTYSRRGDFGAWIFTIARNAWIDRCRRERPQVPLEAIGTEIRTADPSPAQALERGQEASLVRRALQTLPPERRDALILSRFEDLRYEQIAAILGCEVGTVKTRVHRALRELRDAYMELSQVRTS